MVNGTDLVLYKTTSNLGGAITSNKLISNQVHNLLPMVTYTESITGTDDYVCLYVKNDNTTNPILNVVAFIEFNSAKESDHWKIGLGTSDKGGTEQTIANTKIPPLSVNFFDAEVFNNGLFIGTLNAQVWKAIWAWRRVQVNRLEMINNKIRITVFGDPPAGDDGTGSGSGNPPAPGGGSGQQPPPGPPVPDYTWASVGDSACGSTAKTIAQKIHDRGVKFVHHVGDLSYANSVQCFTDLMAPIRAITKITIGNHEEEEGTPVGFVNDVVRDFNLPQPIESLPGVYSYVAENVGFVVTNMYRPYSASSEQYAYVKAQMEAMANNPNVTWKIFTCHEPLYSSVSHHGNQKDFRSVYDPLITANHFDLCLMGHNHNYQRTYPLNWNAASPDSPIQVSKSQDPNYSNPGGCIFLIIGTGGRNHAGFADQAPHVVYQNNTDYGYMVFEMSNSGRTLTGKFYSVGDNLLDQFMLTKGSVTLPPSGTTGTGATNMMTGFSDGIGFEAQLANDNNTTTRWVHTLNPASLTMDIGKDKTVTYIEVRWYEGSPADGRIYTFDVSYCKDNDPFVFTNIMTNKTNSANNVLERYTFPSAVTARYVRLTVKGNSVNNQASVYEFDIGVS